MWTPKESNGDLNRHKHEWIIFVNMSAYLWSTLIRSVPCFLLIGNLTLPWAKPYHRWTPTVLWAIKKCPCISITVIGWFILFRLCSSAPTVWHQIQIVPGRLRWPVTGRSIAQRGRASVCWGWPCHMTHRWPLQVNWGSSFLWLMSLQAQHVDCSL